jgi:hypothetical protein
MMGDNVNPHHPISCDSEFLSFDESGTLSCPHAAAADERVTAALNASVAVLLFELLEERFGGEAGEGAVGGGCAGRAAC